MVERDAEMTKLRIEELFTEEWKINGLPKSKCRNCERGLRLYLGRWYHVEMAGGSWYVPSSACERASPLRCPKCGGRLDYKTFEPSYYDYECQSCIEKEKERDKIGVLTDELRKKLDKGAGDYLKYGTMCAVVLTRNGLFFVDIC